MDLQEKEYSVHYPILWSYMRTEKKSNAISNMKKMWIMISCVHRKKNIRIFRYTVLRLRESWQRRERWLAEKQRERNVSEETKRCLVKLEQAEQYLKKQSDIYMDLSQSAKKKRTYDRSNPAYKWVALAIVLMGGAAFVYGIYALTTHAGFGMYFLLFGLAAIFLFAGANVLPTSKNNKNYIEKRLTESISQMEEYIRVYPDFPVPAHYAHPIVLKRMQEIMKEGRARNIPEALQVLKKDLKALNSSVVVEKEEYDEVVAIKPMFLVMDYK